MSWVDPWLRGSLLALSRSESFKRLAVRLPMTASVVARFVPGETVADCLAAVRSLASEGLTATIDYLGEDTTTPEQAAAIRDGYLELITELSAAGLCEMAEVSVKLTALGVGLPEGRELALGHAREICAAATDAGTTVTLDAEDHTTTDTTIGILAELRREFPETGAVLQAYLHRTPADCELLSGAGSRVRLCKGAYAEPDEVAHQTREEVSAAYVACSRILLAGDGYPMLATHDPEMIAAVDELARQLGRAPGTYELQMLYGIRSDEQRRLAASGERVRVYVPFGTDWWGYFIRRLAERPANLAFFARALFGR
ncbi:MAG TPA: proline dehydrogenase family protein [Propionicimonas sp.]|mgnify:FL=1|nr:proline dehydrogenase family protein [Propionicimonas sp.]HQA78925.1 proline dehydrogenase family protein [Propionicimonas sp.]